VTISDVEGTVEASTNAGSMILTSIDGDLQALTNSGSVQARDVRGSVDLETKAGSIRYEGVPLGDCRFETGAGGITLVLPASVNAEVDLHSSMGTVSVAFPVDGTVKKDDVRGTIGGNGDRSSIYAHTGAGKIEVTRE
jgi:DUF4097 and DUF4098 domain-containing protein YvlB